MDRGSESQERHADIQQLIRLFQDYSKRIYLETAALPVLRELEPISIRIIPAGAMPMTYIAQHGLQRKSQYRVSQKKYWQLGLLSSMPLWIFLVVLFAKKVAGFARHVQPAIEIPYM